jgi:OOP family OmpA-OmpF porin
MNGKLIAFAISLCIAGLMASGANAEGFSVGASIGSSKLEFSESGEDFNFDGSDVGWKVFGKYMFNDNWGLEVGYVDFGRPDDTIFGVDIAVDLYGIDAFLIGSFPASESVDLFGKAGYVDVEAEISTPGVASESENETDLAVGIGAKFHTSDKFSILGEWEWFDVAGSDAAWMLSLGIEVGFN